GEVGNWGTGPPYSSLPHFLTSSLLSSPVPQFLSYDSCPNDSIQPRILPIEIRIAAVEQWLLLAGADAAAGILTVLGIEPVGDIHPCGHAAERREALRVVRRREIAERDVDLGRAAVGHCKGER